ncbi:MAG: hypothetical protein HC910_10170 [Spirulinaceae cyanobacterium SM2_1_0]|nr:hypothetical protein [Spirulinaceae cyanobacterium SM2_1_0]
MDEVPAIDYWQAKVAPLVTTAREAAEAESASLLALASSEAYNRNFTEALEYLRRIAPSSEIGAKIQPKIEEYSRKERIRAMYFLQRAYDHAERGNFKAAIEELQNVPRHTPAGQVASEKLIEYTEKQSIREQLAGTVNWSDSAATTSAEDATPDAPAEAVPEPMPEPGNSAEPFIEMPGDTSSLNPGQQLREAAIPLG